MPALPEGLDEAVHLSDWSADWPARAQALIAELGDSLGPAAPIEHIGSTAVEGLRAKPIIDLMIGAPDAATQSSFARQLAACGWQDMGEAGVSGRRHLRRRSPEAVNLHVVLTGSPLWLDNLAIRDFLRAHPEERAAYAALKAANLAEGADQLLAYSARKAPFMATLTRRAAAWRQAQAGRDQAREDQA